MMKVKEKTIHINPKETLIPSPEIIVEKGFVMGVTVNALYRKKIKEDVEAFIKMNQGKDENNLSGGGREQKHWLMLRVHHSVS